MVFGTISNLVYNYFLLHLGYKLVQCYNADWSRMSDIWSSSLLNVIQLAMWNPHTREFYLLIQQIMTGAFGGNTLWHNSDIKNGRNICLRPVKINVLFLICTCIYFRAYEKNDPRGINLARKRRFSAFSQFWKHLSRPIRSWLKLHLKLY